MDVVPERAGRAVRKSGRAVAPVVLVKQPIPLRHPENLAQRGGPAAGPGALHGARLRSHARAAGFDLAKIAEFAGVSVPNENLNFEKDFYLSIFDALFRSESWIAIVMITDLLGRKERFNVPGTAAKSNWIRRLHSTVTRLAISPTVKRRMRLVRSLLEKSGRA